MSSKADGNMANSFGDTKDNRDNFLSPIGNPLVACMKTEAGNRIIDLNELSDVHESQAWSQHITDVLVSRTSSPVALGILPADCIPMAAWSAKHDILVLAHGARRNLETNVIPELLVYLKDTYGIEPTDLTYYIGPCIKQESYAFDTIDQHQLDDERWAKHIRYMDGRYHIDIVGFLLQQLQEAGVPDSAITINPIDTGSNEDYFSHSRSQRTGETEGRNLFLVQPVTTSKSL